MSFENPNFLKKKYDLHNSDEVESAAERSEAQGEDVPEDPAARIQNYLDRFKEITERTDPDKRERGMRALKHVLHDKFVIKPEEIPEGYFENQRRLAREQGHGDVAITAEMRKQLTEVVITDQATTLDTWTDYLASKDATYPDWLKYYAFRSVLGMGAYDKEKKAFGSRSKGTTKPFPDLNREALAYVLDAIEKKYEGKTTPLEGLEGEEKAKFEQLLKGENFGKLYAWAIEKVTPASPEQLTVTEGEWLKYDKDADHMPLVQSLQGHGTGWCTAGESTAEAQLKTGDFYVYYSHDPKGKPTIPRAAIRMEGDHIAEVRGIAAEQNLDPGINEVVEGKLKEFGSEGEAYKKKVSDMKRLTEVEMKNQLLKELRKKYYEANPKDPYEYGKVEELENMVEVDEEFKLTKDELRFLYEIDSKIEGFGYKKDPRIQEVKEQRDQKKDIALVFDCEPEVVEFNEEDINSKTVVFVGSLSFVSAKGLRSRPSRTYRDKMPENIEYILGDVSFRNSSMENLEQLKFIGGSAYFTNSNIKNLGQLKTILGDVSFDLESNLDFSNVKHGRIRKFENGKELEEAVWG